MKKLFLLALLSAITIVLWAHNENILKHEKEYVEIEKEKEGVEEGRSLSFVECYIDRESSMLEIDYACIGIPDIIILDSNNIPVHYSKAISDSGTVSLNLPSAEGKYTVLIQSSLYSGKGAFYIY